MGSGQAFFAQATVLTERQKAFRLTTLEEIKLPRGDICCRTKNVANVGSITKKWKNRANAEDMHPGQTF